MLIKRVSQWWLIILSSALIAFSLYWLLGLLTSSYLGSSNDDGLGRFLSWVELACLGIFLALGVASFVGSVKALRKNVIETALLLAYLIPLGLLAVTNIYFFIQSQTHATSEILYTSTVVVGTVLNLALAIFAITAKPTV